MARNIPTPLCVVCKAPSVAKQLCDKHYRRFKNYGDVKGGLRPPDWGSREKHPLYSHWSWTARSKGGRDPAWNDFWQFVRDVGDRPSPKHRLRRFDNKKPWGPLNSGWQEALTGESYTTANAEGKKLYQRDWRAANPLRAKANDLRKNYGLELADYHDMVEAQDGKCAICKEPGPLCVDHDHATGKVRGLLCHLCNRALGLLNDSVLRLQCATRYLELASQGLQEK